MSPIHTNHLIQESSPYLLQHAHNPVNWFPWGNEALDKARDEDKLILVSIGYSACHWCHVMEHECFEDEEVAALMNQHFVCIKVDREERPDIDQVYMNALQLLTRSGGWPLNMFALPDGSPVHGGTYFPKKQWMQLLDGLANLYQNDTQRVIAAAAQLSEGVAQSELIATPAAKQQFTEVQIQEIMQTWRPHWDTKLGGSDRAPKFPLPNSLQYMLRHAFYTYEADVANQVELTLDKMADGGIYDQLAGGFARYSVDERWFAPHFEKMLYDNGQLLSLYSEAYTYFQKPLYQQIVDETVSFLTHELRHENGAFFSALDADSEGEEGRFYCFEYDDFMAIPSADTALFARYFGIEQQGNWEHGKNILNVSLSEADFAAREGIDATVFNFRLKQFKQIALEYRAMKVRPGLDDKILTSWNGLAIRGLADAYKAFGKPEYLQLAIDAAKFIAETQTAADGQLWRNFKNGRSTISGFLDDYAFTTDAYIALFEVTGNVLWIQRARSLTEYCLLHFFDAKSQMFFFTSDTDRVVVARKMELNDGVLPASNSSMARNLFVLGSFFDKTEWLEIAEQMLLNVVEYIPSAGAYYSNWAILLTHFVYQPYELCIVGAESLSVIENFRKKFRPDILTAMAELPSSLPILDGRGQVDKTLIYVCINKACQLPTENVSEANLLLMRG